MTVNLGKNTAALALLGSALLLGTPAFAIEPDTDSPAGPELPAPRTDRPDFQQDDQTGAVIDPREEGADPSPPIADRAVPIAPEVVPMAPADAGPNASATSPGEENKGKPPVARYWVRNDLIDWSARFGGRSFYVR